MFQLQEHTSVIHEIFGYFSKCSALFAKVYNYTASSFLCFFNCFLHAKYQVGTAVDNVDLVYLRILLRQLQLKKGCL